MANISAAGAGDWNSTTPNAPWPSGVIPTAADAVNLNGKLLTMAAGTYATCLSLTDTAGTTAKLTMAAGTVLSCPTLLGKAMVEVAGKGVTIYAETIDNSAGVVGARPTISVLSGGMLSGRGNVGGGANYQTIEPQENGLISAWIGDINPGNSLYPAIYGPGSINDIWGDITGGSSINAYGINCSVQEVHGNIKGGSASGAHGIKLSGGAAIGHIYGNVEGGSASGAHGVDLSISGFGYCNLYKVYGNAIGGSASGAHGIRVTGSGTGYNQFISGVGDVIPGVSGAYGLWMDANGYNTTYQWAYITTGRSPTDTGCSAGTSTPVVRQASAAEVAKILLNMPVQPRHIAASADILFGVARYQNAPASMNGTLFSLDPGVSKVLTTAANPYYINSVAKTPTLPVSAVLATSGGTCILPAAGSVALGVPVGVPPAAGTAVLTAQSVWAYASRTLTGAGSGIGPTAGLSTARIGARIRRYESQPLFAYVYTASDIPATIASVSTITYSIVSLQGDGSEAAIAGHANVSLTPSSVLYDTIQSDAVATGWNFKHQIDLSLGDAFATLGRYIVRYKFTPVSGLPFWVDFDVSCG